METTIETIFSSMPLTAPPTWALVERALIQLMNDAIAPYLAKYLVKDTANEGTLIWCGKLHPGDSADDFFEAYVNWPLFYLLGGDEVVLSASLRGFEAVLQQLNDLGALYQEYERGSDQFHQGEGNLLFYGLCMADPQHPRLQELARRYADFFLADAPADNYDAAHQLIRAPRNGSQGPRWGYFEGNVSYDWRFDMAVYGLPYHDLPGITTYADLRDPDKARRMGAAMQERMGRGDVATNLIATSLATNAFLLMGDPRYRAWVTEYVSAWAARRDAATGLLADNVGPTGRIGELIGNKWYGGLYGWTWPHGYYNLSIAAAVAATNAAVLTGDAHHLDLIRTLVDAMLARGEQRPLDLAHMSLPHHFRGITAQLSANDKTFQIPYRYSDQGWFDWQPVPLTVPSTIWSVSHAAKDMERIEWLHARSGYDWSTVVPFHTKEDAGHEEPWLAYLAGNNPTYPETMLAASISQVYERLQQIRDDHEDLTSVPDDQIDSKVHHWQLMNPITTEALVQLTLGAPQLLYNGGLLHAPLRYFDGVQHRPGLPREVAALVTQQDAAGLTVQLVNLSATAEREVIIQAGAMGEHAFTSVKYAVPQTPATMELGYPGVAQHLAQLSGRANGKQDVQWLTRDLNTQHLAVRLLPGTQITLTLAMKWQQHSPSYNFPWSTERSEKQREQESEER